jgi:tryptophan synthase beta subunit
MISGRSDRQYCQKNPDKIKGCCFEDGNEFNVIEDDREYYHKTYMSFVRNYFHHPSPLYKEHLRTSNLRINVLLKKV